jgi:hypothetical protein
MDCKAKKFYLLLDIPTSMDDVKGYQIDDSSAFSTTCETLVTWRLGGSCHIV